MSGLRFFVSSISRQMMSDAMAEPPGLLIRSTMARTELSVLRLAQIFVDRVGPDDVATGESALRPDAISPDA